MWHVCWQYCYAISIILIITKWQMPLIITIYLSNIRVAETSYKNKISVRISWSLILRI
jgi:hypothetical protein